jgi:transaldolase
MANDKLKEGIDGFSKAIIDLEAVLEKRLSEIGEPATAAR